MVWISGLPVLHQISLGLSEAKFSVCCVHEPAVPILAWPVWHYYYAVSVHRESPVYHLSYDTERWESIEIMVSPWKTEGIMLPGTWFRVPGHKTIYLVIESRCEEINVRCTKYCTQLLKNLWIKSPFNVIVEISRFEIPQYIFDTWDVFSCVLFFSF